MEESATHQARPTTSSGTSQQDVSTDRLFSQIAASGSARQQNGDSHDYSVQIYKNNTFYVNMRDPRSIPSDQSAPFCKVDSMLPHVKWPREWTPRKEDGISARSNQLSREQFVRKLTSFPQNTTATAEDYSRFARSQGPQQNISSYLMDTYNFRDWFGSRTSRKLLVQPPCTTSKISTGSLAAATLHPVFTQIEPSLTITFFCGAEKSNSGGWKLSKVLMANLLHQMILACPSNRGLESWASLTSTQQHENFLEYRNMNYMCPFFEHLIKESEYNVIFCLIDDVRCLEDENSADTTAIFAMLERLIACSSREPRTAFKLMLFTAYDKGPIMASTEQSDIVSVRERDLRNHSLPNPKQIASFLEQYATI